MDEITVERDGAIGIVSLTRPERRNALTRRMIVELTQVAASFEHEQDVRVVIFRGRGSDFSVGADLKDPDHAATIHAPLGERFAEAISAFMEKRKPNFKGR